MRSMRRIDYLPLSEIQRAAPNAKRHDSEGIAASMNRFGVIDIPVMDDRTERLVHGHGRVDSWTEAQTAGRPPPDGVRLDENETWLVPVVRGWSSVDDLEADAAGVALNQLTVAGGWSLPDLGAVLSDLRPDPNRLVGLGFSVSGIDDFLASLKPPEQGSTGPVFPASGILPPESPVTVRGDVWTLGAHRLLCGDCRDPQDVVTVLDGATVNLAVTSPPYAEQREYDETSGFAPIPPDEYVDWFDAVQANVAAHLADDGSWLVNLKPPGEMLDTHLYVFDLVAAHVRRWGWHFATEFCWERLGVPKGPVLRLKNGFEPVYQFARGRWKFRPDNVRHASDDVPMNVGPGGGDTGWRNRHGVGGVIDPAQRRHSKPAVGGLQEFQGTTNDGFQEARGEGLAYPSNRLPSFSGTHEAVGHGAAFPVGLPGFFARLFTDPGETVFDPFSGSGSTLLAAEVEGRVGYGIELSPAYCDVTLMRWVAHHPDQIPVRVSDGLRFQTPVAV